MPSKHGASQVPLREDEERSGIQIRVEREKRYNIVVWPPGPRGGPAPSDYWIFLLGRSHTSSGGPDGSWIIPDIPSGRYKLVGFARTESENVGAGYTDVDVTNQDVTVHLQMGGLARIGGIVKADDARIGVLTDFKIGIQSLEGAGQGEAVNADGHFQFARVLPGNYVFRILQEPTNAVLRSVKCAGSDGTAESPLRVGDRQKVTDCELVLGKER